MFRTRQQLLFITIITPPATVIVVPKENAKIKYTVQITRRVKIGSVQIKN